MSKYDELLHPQVVATPRTFKELRSPPGLGAENGTKTAKSATQITKQDDDRVAELKAKKAWEIATGPAKSLPMTLIMNYMTGNSLQIIPMTMAFMLLWNPIKAIFSDTNKAFRGLESKDDASFIFQAKVVFVLCQSLNMAVGVYKLYKMGLIPNREADWLAWKEVVQFKESFAS